MENYFPIEQLRSSQKNLFDTVLGYLEPKDICNLREANKKIKETIDNLDLPTRSLDTRVLERKLSGAQFIHREIHKYQPSSSLPLWYRLNNFVKRLEKSVIALPFQGAIGLTLSFPIYAIPLIFACIIAPVLVPPVFLLWQCVCILLIGAATFYGIIGLISAISHKCFRLQNENIATKVIDQVLENKKMCHELYTVQSSDNAISIFGLEETKDLDRCRFYGSEKIETVVKNLPLFYIVKRLSKAWEKIENNDFENAEDFTEALRGNV